MEFLIIILFKGWKAFESVLGIILAIIAYLLPNTSLENKIIFLAFGFLIIFIIKIIKQTYMYYIDLNKPIKVIRKVQGDGAYFGQDVIIMENPDNLRDGLLLTLCCKSSGAIQPICILEIIDSSKGHDLITIQLIPDSSNYDINKYFEEDSRLKSLYAKPLINSNDIKTFQQI